VGGAGLAGAGLLIGVGGWTGRTRTPEAEVFWRAKKAVEALDVQWLTNGAENITDESLRSAHLQALDGKAHTMAGGEDAESALRQSPRVLVAEYDVPYVPHLCMEPINCTVLVKNGKAEVWTGTQAPGMTRQSVAKGARLSQGDVTSRKQYLGGGFGRRNDPRSSRRSGNRHSDHLLAQRWVFAEHFFLGELCRRVGGRGRPRSAAIPAGYQS
jgi:hypothetical protein